MATKPTNTAAWNTGGANNVEPNGAKKILGWITNEAPPSATFNWWQKLIHEWVAYLSDGIFTGGLQVTGAAAGNGVTGIGGTGNTKGVVGTGIGTGTGVEGTGGATNGTGVKGVGTGAGTGVDGVGGNSSYSVGVYGTGGSAGGDGVSGEGTDDGYGVVGLGGPTDGIGVRGIGQGNGQGVLGQGAGTGLGVWGVGGPGGVSIGVQGTGGTAGGMGGAFQRGDGSSSLAALGVVGTIDLSLATAPAGTLAILNQLTIKNLIKGWALLRYQNGANPDVIESFNVTSATRSAADQVTVNWAQDFASGFYGVWCVKIGVAGDAGSATAGRDIAIESYTQTAGAAVVDIYTRSTGANPAEATLDEMLFMVIALGAQ